jgi:hypothetical protein
VGLKDHDGQGRKEGNHPLGADDGLGPRKEEKMTGEESFVWLDNKMTHEIGIV